MPRYEITGCATDTFTLDEIRQALRDAGAARINRRRAFGWSNQPRVATFAAEDDETAERLCEEARKRLQPASSLPSLTPTVYA